MHVKLLIPGITPVYSFENNSRRRKKEFPERIIGNFKGIMCASLVMCSIVCMCHTCVMVDNMIGHFIAKQALRH